MSGPPPNIPPSELWSALQQMPRPYRVVDFPRKREDGTPIGQLAIWVLTPAEQIAANLAAERIIREAVKASLPKEALTEKDLLGYQVAFTNAAQIEILLRACRDASDVTRPAFPNARAIRDHLTVDECACLIEAYFDVAAQVGPIIASLSQDDADAWIDRLIEGGSHDPLGSFSSGALRTLLRTSVARLTRSPTVSSSAGSPPESTESGLRLLPDDPLDPPPPESDGD
ncbi:MAG: hypothetical protein JST00_30185 [Deltaproteobacteria bacterium]|nr:hypothetical protein [Deltaproteobacteria bacterium]